MCFFTFEFFLDQSWFELEDLSAILRLHWPYTEDDLTSGAEIFGLSLSGKFAAFSYFVMGLDLEELLRDKKPHVDVLLQTNRSFTHSCAK